MKQKFTIIISRVENTYYYNYGKRLFFIQFRGFETLKFIKALEKVDAPIKPILIMRKLKIVLPSLKVPLERPISSNIIYKLTCTGCHSSYVGFTTRHLCSRKMEHMGKKGIFEKHFQECNQEHNRTVQTTILKSSNRGMIHLSILEALYIRELKPSLNTKDDYIQRPLRIRI